MQERVAEEEMVTPGEMLGKGSQVKAGRGAYIAPYNNTVYAALTGRRSLVPPSPESPDQRPTVEVIGHKAHGPVPEPGCVVITRVTKVTARMASADIMCVGSKAVREKFSGIIRQQDVRATEIDKVDMHTSFRPGDIVKASVVSFVSRFSATMYLYISDMFSRNFWVPNRTFLTCYITHLITCFQVGCIGFVWFSFVFLIFFKIIHTSMATHMLQCWHVSVNKTVIDKLSLGDARAYYLSTAQNELGVVSAESMAGGTMVPISWTEMQCPLTGQIEQRKVAKVGA